MRRARRRTASLWEGCPIWAPLLSNPRRSTPTSRGFTPSWHGAATGRRARGRSLTDRRHAKLSSGLEARGSELGCLGARNSARGSKLGRLGARSSELGARGRSLTDRRHAKLSTGLEARDSELGRLGARNPARGSKLGGAGLEAGAQGSKLELRARSSGGLGLETQRSATLTDRQHTETGLLKRCRLGLAPRLSGGVWGWLLACRVGRGGLLARPARPRCAKFAGPKTRGNWRAMWPG